MNKLTHLTDGCFAVYCHFHIISVISSRSKEGNENLRAMLLNFSPPPAGVELGSLAVQASAYKCM